MRLLLFAGTTEGRLLVERLRELPVGGTISVATGYGEEMLKDLPERFTVRVGRLDAGEMLSLMRSGKYRCVVDATHPYAAAASANIRDAATRAGLPCFRLLRGESLTEPHTRVESAAAAAETLAGMPGNILLATGAKELAAFRCVPEYIDRMYVRVLPMASSIDDCIALGFRRGHIIAMQGPFSRELNCAILRQFGIAVMVTKDGGVEGGFPEKMQAAADAGVHVVVIARPPDRDGKTLDEVLAAITALS